MVQLGLPALAYETILASRSADTHITFLYRVTALITAEDGAQWFVADEHLIVDPQSIEPYNFPDLFNGRAEIPIQSRHHLYTDDAKRRVYLPFRDASETVVSLLTVGPACD